MRIFCQILVVVGIFSVVAAAINLFLGHSMSAQIVTGLVGFLVGLAGLLLQKVFKKSENL
jgi:uncharacterized membrane protein YdcZ (DUF606 family)